MRAIEYRMPKEASVEATPILLESTPPPVSIPTQVDSVVAVPDVPPEPNVAAASAAEVGDMDMLLVAAGWPAVLLGQAKSVITCESRGNASAVSSEGARGLFQLMPVWADYAGVSFDALFDPLVNARAAWATYNYDIARGQPAWNQWVCRP